MLLQNKSIVLGLTGSIACYKSAELVRSLVKAGAVVQVVMTQAATQFITPTTMQVLSQQPVIVEMAARSEADAMPHIALSRQADLILVAPASVNFMAKLAAGFADQLLSTLCLARQCPLLLAPAMNQAMWQNSATQRNLQQLQQDGVLIYGPDIGDQACGETGPGRLLSPEILLDILVGFFQKKSLQGKKVLITAGPTFEPMDAVRGLTNRSSGKMGFALAKAAVAAGAYVQMVCGPNALAVPYQVNCFAAETAEQMLAQVLALAPESDLFISVAAVTDWRFDTAHVHKIKKDKAAFPFSLIPNPDILFSVAHLARAPYCVGFAVESSDLAQRCREKLQKKGVQMIIGNSTEAFNSEFNEILLCDAKGISTLARLPKQILAYQLIQEIAARLYTHST